MFKKVKFNNQHIERLKEIYKDSSNITEASKRFAKELNIEYGDPFRRYCSKILERFKVTENKVRIEDSSEFKEALNRKLDKSQYYIITWEQNETPLHQDFFNNILAYKEFLGAELSVILGRYKNPTSVFTDSKNENWNEQTRPYWDANNHNIHKHLKILANIKISPTRKYPLTGIQDLADNKSVIVGHPKLHLKTEPTLANYPDRMIFTTGAVTLPNYTDSASGVIGEGSHKFGFVIVEIADDEVFFVRQVEAEQDGSFIDLCYEVKNQEVTIVDKALGLICGDTHLGHLNPEIDKQNDLICEYFNVDNVVLHDIIDGESCNNHKIKSAIEQFKRYDKGEHLIHKELENLTSWVATKLKYNPVVPQANHNSRFDRILDEDWRKDIHNAKFYLEFTKKVLDGEVTDGVVSYWLKHHFGDKVTTLKHTDSFKIGKYECSQHGDNGSNGAKGSPITFRNLGIPIILAHTHTPYRADDTLYVGTNTELLLDYNQKGASSWVHCNILVAKNGIAQHIIFNNYRFTTFKQLNIFS